MKPIDPTTTRKGQKTGCLLVEVVGASMYSHEYLALAPSDLPILDQPRSRRGGTGTRRYIGCPCKSRRDGVPKWDSALETLCLCLREPGTLDLPHRAGRGTQADEWRECADKKEKKRRAIPYLTTTTLPRRGGGQDIKPSAREARTSHILLLNTKAPTLRILQV